MENRGIGQKSTIQETPVQVDTLTGQLQWD